MLSAKKEDLINKAGALCERINTQTEFKAFVTECTDEPGGGSLPGVYLPGAGCFVDKEGLSVMNTEKLLRTHDVPVISRIVSDRTLLSVRTLMEGDEDDIERALRDTD